MTPAEQLADELHARLVGPLRAIGCPDLADLVEARLPGVVERLIGQLAAEDERLAGQTVTDLAGVGWDLNPAPEWWQTPLGRLVARQVAHASTDTVTLAYAGLMLGVGRSTVLRLVERGRLDPGDGAPGGGRGVRLWSVLERMLRTEDPT